MTSNNNSGGGVAENGWFNDFKSLAKSTKDSILPAIDGIASMIHRSAMTVAAEIAQLERDAEMDAERWRAENYGHTTTTSHRSPLPWEIAVDQKRQQQQHPKRYVVHEALKFNILKLSTDERTFLQPFTDAPAAAGNDFALTGPLIELIQRLLAIDDNLASMHAKLSGKSCKRDKAVCILSCVCDF